MSMLISQSDAIIISTYLVGCWHTPACVCPMFINAHQKLLQPKHNIAFIPYYGESPVVSKYRKKTWTSKENIKSNVMMVTWVTHTLTLSLSLTLSHLFASRLGCCVDAYVGCCDMYDVKVCFGVLRNVRPTNGNAIDGSNNINHSRPMFDKTVILHKWIVDTLCRSFFLFVYSCWR